MRHKIGVIFGSPETTTGGNALKFYASVRIDVRRIGQLKSGDTPIGNKTRARVVKNKLASPFREAEFGIRWGKGIDEEPAARPRSGLAEQQDGQVARGHALHHPEQSQHRRAAAYERAGGVVAYGGMRA